LSDLSARALRLWIYLAMKATHPPVTMPMVASVAVARGQYLTSTRRLRRELKTSPSLILCWRLL
jgi:hypothetical protein